MTGIDNRSQVTGDCPPKGSSQDLVERLEAAVAVDAAAFPALSEALRRQGRLAEAERVARQGLEYKPGTAAGGLALALALLDQGRVEEARRELERAAGEALVPLAGDEPALSSVEPVAKPDFDGAITDHELDRAFVDAEAERDQLVDADDVAQQAIREADLAPADEIAPTSAFATHTMADVLESQGDSRGAEEIRAALAARTAPDSDRRQQTIATLERWLENLKKHRQKGGEGT